MEFLLCSLYASFFLWLIYRLKFFEIDGISRRGIAAIFILKTLCGIGLWAVYTYIYTDRGAADIYRFFDDSKFIYDALFTSPLDYVKMIFGIGDNNEHFNLYYMKMNHWHREFDAGLFNEYRTLTRMNALFRIFSFGYFNVHTVFICFLSLIGLASIYKAFVPFLQKKKKELIVIVFLLPSVLFWGSGLLKEGLILFVSGMLIYFFTKALREKFSILLLVELFVFLFLLLLTRLYLFAIMVPALISYWWVQRTKGRMAGIKYLTVFSIYFFILLTIHYALPKYNVLEVIADKQHQAINQANGGSWLMKENKLVYIEPTLTNRVTFIDSTRNVKINKGVSYKYYFREHPRDTFTVTNSNDTNTYWSFYDQPQAGSRIAFTNLQPTVFSFLKNTPQAIINSILRPTVFDIKSLLVLMPAVENVFVTLFIICCIIFHLNYIPHKNLFYFCFFVSVPILILVGLTTPVMGALVRYKVPVILFFLVALLIVLDKEKVKTYWKRLTKKPANVTSTN